VKKTEGRKSRDTVPLRAGQRQVKNRKALVEQPKTTVLLIICIILIVDIRTFGGSLCFRLFSQKRFYRRYITVFVMPGNLWIR
jgi:hypothetical protein